jgi:hypothetical protein
MWYIDVTEGGEQYRGVYFSSYRPYYAAYVSNTDNSYQDDNGYATKTVYWFKYEPLSWTILKESGGTALILCDSIIDSQQFDYDGTSSNNYAESTIRAWLNDTFYTTAFSELQREIILTTEVDNSAESTGDVTNTHTCRDTSEKIFLLSYADLTNTEYGFAADKNSSTVRDRQTTDYAQVQGCVTLSDDYSIWWLRSSETFSNFYAQHINADGSISTSHVYSTSYGVVPALQISL